MLSSSSAVISDVGRDRFEAQPIADGLREVGLILGKTASYAWPMIVSGPSSAVGASK
jgi:hypothetical protein